MKTVLLLLMTISIFSCALEKKKTTGENTGDSEEITGLTEIIFNEEIHDFGRLKSGEIVVNTFVFTNTGKYNLVIDKIESACGCVKVNSSKEPVKPGNSGLIEVEFNSSGLFGNQFKSIEIYANCKEPKHLAIFAEVKNEELEIKY